MKKTRAIKWALRFGAAGMIALAALFGVVWAFTGHCAGKDVRVIRAQAPPAESPQPSSEPPSRANHLRVVTLNLAHGRSDGVNQLLQSRKRIRRNLAAAGEILLQQTPAVVALQEVDAPSFWSGNFDHVAFMAEQCGLTHAAQGLHVDALRLSYGTALLARQPFCDPVSHTFDPSPPTFPKGFVAVELTWPGQDELAVHVVSLHLDYSRRNVRQHQVEEIARYFEATDNEVILMGDFNCAWDDKEPTLREVAQRLNLHAYQPDSSDLKTFPLNGRRLDWILISSGLDFARYEVLPVTVSDHLPVLAEIVLRGDGQQQAAAP